MRTEKTFAVINGLEPDNFYNFTAISVNHYGFSTFVPIIGKRISLSSDDNNFLSSRSEPKTSIGNFFCSILNFFLLKRESYWLKH